MSSPSDEVNWALATWEGSRREQLRRWAALPLIDAIAAVEEMERVAQALGPATGASVASAPPHLPNGAESDVATPFE
jgi:hypothetical protein